MRACRSCTILVRTPGSGMGRHGHTEHDKRTGTERRDLNSTPHTDGPQCVVSIHSLSPQTHDVFFNYTLRVLGRLQRKAAKRDEPNGSRRQKIVWRRGSLSVLQMPTRMRNALWKRLVDSLVRWKIRLPCVARPPAHAIRLPVYTGQTREPQLPRDIFLFIPSGKP